MNLGVYLNVKGGVSAFTVQFVIHTNTKRERSNSYFSGKYDRAVNRNGILIHILSAALVFVHMCMWAQETDSLQLTVNTISTGRTTGHIANVIVFNSQEEALNIMPQIFYIPSFGDFQPYVACITQQVRLGPLDSAVISLEGYCADVTKPPVPSGRFFPPIHTWVSVDENTWLGMPLITNQQFEGITIHLLDSMVNRFESSSVSAVLDSSRHFIDTVVLSDFVPLLPGTSIPLRKVLSSGIGVDIVAPILIESLNRLAVAFDRLRNADNKLTPLAPRPLEEREGVIQHAFWIYTTAVQGGVYSKDEFVSRVYAQYKVKTGDSPKRLSKAQRTELDTGISVFWDVFIATGVNAQVFWNSKDNDSTFAIRTVPISALWDLIQLTNVRMKPDYPFLIKKPFPALPVVAGAAGAGVGAYFFLKKEDLSELCTFSLSTEVTHTTCGLANGSASVTVDPPGDYFYFWSNNGAGPTLYGRLAGIYSVTVTPKTADCPQVISDTIENTDFSFSAEFDVTDASCGDDDGKVHISVTPPGDYEITWSDTQVGPVRTNLVAGKYSVTISLGGHCTEDYQVVVGEKPPAFNADVSVDSVTCGMDDGSASIDVFPQGSYDYHWSNGDTTSVIQNLAAGEYQVTISPKGTTCDTIINIVIEEPSGEFIVDVQIISGNCAGTGADIIMTTQTHGSGPLFFTVTSPSGLLTFEHAPGTLHFNTLMDVLPGAWHVEVWDLTLNESCIDEVDFLLESTLEIAVTQTTLPSTAGAMDGVIEISINPHIAPPYVVFVNTDFWGLVTDSVFTVEGLGAGDYRIVIRDMNGCESNVLNVSLRLPGIESIEIGYGLGPGHYSPVLIPEHPQINGAAFMSSFVDASMQYRIDRIRQMSRIMLYRHLQYDHILYRFSHQVELLNYRHKGLDFKVHGGLMVDVASRVPLEQYWTIQGSVSRKAGRLVNVSGSVTVRGWESIEMPIVEIGVRLPMRDLQF